MPDPSTTTGMPVPPPGRPLHGLTLLLVDDSRFASDAVRLMTLRSGARLRRADCLTAAHRHLRVYRPDIVVVDLGLPDGDGTTLIAELAHLKPRPSVILGTSGDDTASDAVIAAGANGFLPKPLTDLAFFQQSILRHLPGDDPRNALHRVPAERVEPDPIAFHDDMVRAADLLNHRDRLDYVAQFVGTVARTAADLPLARAAEGLRNRHQQGSPATAELTTLSSLVDARLAAYAPI